MLDKPPNRLQIFFENRPAWQTGIFLLVIGTTSALASERYLANLSPWNKVVLSLGEALLIAGLLALLVDPFLKARLQRDASKSIFEHMLGFDHEPELRAKLRSIAFETKLYRKDLKLDCEIRMPDPSGRVNLILSTEFEVLNPSLENIQYLAGWTFVEVDKPAHCEITQIIGDKEPKLFHPIFKSEGSGYVGAKAPPVAIEPRSSGHRFRFVSNCHCEAPQDWYHTIFFGLPTIDAVITVRAPEGWRVWVGGQEDKNNNTARWHHNGLFMPSDMIEMHWRKPDQTTASVSNSVSPENSSVERAPHDPKENMSTLPG